MRILGQRSLDFRVDVAGDVHDISAAIVIEVGEAGAPLDVAVLDAEACRRRDVFEESAAERLIQRRDVIGEVGLEQVEPSIVVDVTDGEPHPGLRASLFAERDPAPERLV